MDSNNYGTPRNRKRVTKKMAQRRRITALAIMLAVIILGIVLICNACSGGDEDAKGNKNPASSQTTTTTTMVPSATIPVVTTTTIPVPTADPNDPNTITAISLDKYSVNLEVGQSDMPWVTMKPEESTEKGEIWESSDTAIATVDNIGNITGVSAGTCYVTVKSQNNPSVYAEVKVTVISPDGSPSGAAGQTPSATTAGALQQTSVTSTATASSGNKSETNTVSGATYVNGILIANKSYGLPADYAPGLDPTTESQFNALSAAAAQEGLNIWLASGFRSYEYQSQIYNNYANLYGADTADTFSARPGYSEHQTGLAIDVNSIDDTFAGTPEAIWLENHAHEYGFIIRYPKGKESITGYKYEPWHIRYLGVETATAVYKSGLTLEEYLGIDSKYQ